MTWNRSQCRRFSPPNPASSRSAAALIAPPPPIRLTWTNRGVDWQTKQHPFIYQAPPHLWLPISVYFGNTDTHGASITSSLRLRTESDNARRYRDRFRHISSRHSELLISYGLIWNKWMQRSDTAKKGGTFSRGSFLFSKKKKRQHGCLGEPQYLSGTSARSRHRLLLRHALAGRKLAAGTSQLFHSSPGASSVAKLIHTLTHALWIQASTFFIFL